MFYKNPNISYKLEGWFSKLFPSLDISLFICNKKLPYTFDLVHSIDTILCSDIGARLLCERGAWSGERGAGTLRAGSRN
jgi:hypothetical protein